MTARTTTSPHLIRLGIPPEEAGTYIRHLREARASLQAAAQLMHDPAIATSSPTPLPRALSALGELTLELDRLGVGS